MHADLMRAPGLEPALHVRIAGVAREHLPVRHRAPPAIHHRHALAVAAVARDGRVHRTAILAQVSHHDALVGARKRVVRELGGEELVGIVIFRRDDEPARVAVDAVHDAGAQRAANTEKARAAVK